MALLMVPAGIKLTLWLVNLVGGVVALFIALYLLILHDDMK